MCNIVNWLRFACVCEPASPVESMQISPVYICMALLEQCVCTLFNAVSRDHSFPQQIFPNSMGQFAKFRGLPQQIFHILINFLQPRTPPNMHYLLLVLQLTDAVCLPSELAIYFS